MSKKKAVNAPNKIIIRQFKGKNGIMTGANTEVLLNGEPVKLCKSVQFNVDAKGIAEVTFTVYGSVEVVGNLYNVGIKEA